MPNYQVLLTLVFSVDFDPSACHKTGCLNLDSVFYYLTNKQFGYLRSMKIAFFSTKSYDREFFDHYVTTHEIIYFEARLNKQTVNLATGCNAVCVFVNDRLSNSVITELKKIGVQLIALRCAGFNNVDLAAAKENGIAVVRVPA